MGVPVAITSSAQASPGGKIFRHAADSLMLIRPVHDGGVDRCLRKQGMLLADEAETLKVCRGEEPSHHTRMGQTDLPKPRDQPVRQEAKGRKWLLSRNLLDIGSELLFALSWAARCAFGFDHREHETGRFVQTVVCDTWRRCSVVALNGDLKADLAAVA